MTLLLLLFIWLGQGQQAASESQTPTDTQAQTSPTTPSATPDQNPLPTKNDSQQHQDHSALWSDPLIILQLLLIIAVVIQALIYAWQATLMKQTVSVAEKSANTAREAFHVGEAPYFGVAQIAPEKFEGEYAPRVKVTFVNGGKTPAWHFHSKARAIIGRTPEDGYSYDLDTEWHDLPNTFFRTNDSRTFGYEHHLFRYSPELEKRLISNEVWIFMIIKIHYRDFRKVWHHRDFSLVWDNQYRNFKDYDAEEENCGACKKTEKTPD